MYLIKIGKSRANIKLAVIGVIMMLYTYFTNSPWVDWGIGAGLSGVAYLVWE